MRRRESPYSRIEAIRRSRAELVGLILVTVALGLLLNLLASGFYQALSPLIESRPIRWLALVGGCLLIPVLVLLVALLFYRRTESQRALIEIWLPYHWSESGQPAIAQRHSYQVTVHARRAFARYFQKNSSQTQAFIIAWRKTMAQGVPFQQFIASIHAQLIQYLLLCVLHRYGDESLGPEAAYGWWKVNLPARQLSLNDLPPPLRDNPFLRADQDLEKWRLWWPQEVWFSLEPETGNPFPRWRLIHQHYGHLEVQAHPQLIVAGRESQPVQVFLQRLKLHRDSQLVVVGTRLEAVAHFRWAFLPGSEPFHDWATGLLSYLDEALDWGYFLATRPDRLITDLDWKIGWVPEGASVWKKLQEIEARLETRETGAASRKLEPKDNP